MKLFTFFFFFLIGGGCSFCFCCFFFEIHLMIDGLMDFWWWCLKRVEKYDDDDYDHKLCNKTNCFVSKIFILHKGHSSLRSDDVRIIISQSERQFQQKI